MLLGRINGRFLRCRNTTACLYNSGVNRIAQFWDDAVVPALVEYIRIPAKSPHFDEAWEKNGHIDAAVKLAEDWCRRHAVPGMKMEVVRLPGRTPVLFLEVEGD